MSVATTNRATPPKPPCQISGLDGNVFAVLGRVRRALEAADQHERASEFLERAYAARGYDDVLRLCFEYVDVR